MSGDTMPKLIDLTGQVFGRLIVLHRSGKSNAGKARWLCQCECGKLTEALGNRLQSGHTKSCGCLQALKVAEVHTKHGLYKHSAYKAWTDMLHRCNNPSSGSYKYYGARGITVCDRWLDVENFIADMGERPAGLSIERKDVNKGYCKENCIWADAKTQARNRRSSRVETFNGKSATLIEHCEDVGLSYSTVNYRLNSLSWSLEKALTTTARVPVEYTITSKPQT